MKRPEPQYDPIADVYDVAWGNSQSEADLMAYAEISRQTGGPILDLGTGTGRVSTVLASEGYNVVALDCSRQMLDIAMARADRILLAEQRERIEFRYGDMTNFDCTERFALVILPFSVLWECRSKETVRATLANAHRILRDGGCLFFDCSYYGLGGRTPPPRERHSRREHPDGSGGTVILEERDTYDSQAGITTKWLFVRKLGPDGRVIEKREHRIERVYLSPKEVWDVLILVGFSPPNCELFGTFDFRTRLDSPRFIDPDDLLHGKARQVWNCIK